MKKEIMIVRCPTCHKSIRYSLDNECRPFCSERCQTADIAAWAEESYSIPDGKGIDPEMNSEFF